MNNFEGIEIKRINNKEKKLKQIILEKHYLKKWPAAVISYAFYKDKDIIGVAIYGMPAASICKKFNNEVIELVRLFTFDENKNTPLSFLLTKSLKMLKQDLPKYKMVISFAQLNANHVGAIYQATSWIYVGLTGNRVNYKIKGLEKKHSRAILFGLKVKEVREILGDELYMLARPQKAKYFFPLYKRKKAIKDLERLNFKIQPYPKLNDPIIQKQIEKDQADKLVSNNWDQTKYEEIKAKINHYKNNNNITKEENVIKGGNNE